MKKETIDKIQAFMEDVLPTMYDDVKLVEVKGVNDNHITVGFVCPKKHINELLSNMDIFEDKFDLSKELDCDIDEYALVVKLYEKDHVELMKLIGDAIKRKVKKFLNN